MKNKEKKSSAPPWEESGEEPQSITGAEASAAAAVVSGKTDRNANATGRSSQSGQGAQSGESGKNPPRNRWQPSQMGYRWVVRNVGFLLFLAALAVLYIYNGHYADNISRDLNTATRQVKELQYEYKTLKSEVMFRSKESELAKAVAPFGLEELTRPPFVLVDSSKR